MKKIKLLLGAYIDSVNAQDINCYNIAKHIDKDKFEVHALTHGGDINIPGVVCHPISKEKVLKNIEKYLTMRKVDADVYYLPRVEKVDIEFSKRSKKCIISSVEIQTVYENETYKKFFNEYISGYFCISEFLNSLNMKYWGKKVPVLYLGVDVDKKEIVHNSISTIVFVGSVVERKRPNLFLEIARSFPEINFIIVGDGDLLPAMKKLVSENGTKNVTFLGKLNNRSVLKTFEKCDLLLMTSEKEGLPKVVLEAASRGVPSIYINEYYTIDYIENGINGYGVNSIEDAKNCISMLINNTSDYKTMSTNSKQLVDTYNWKALILGYEQFFKEAMKCIR